MVQTLLILVILSFAGMLFVNIYFRVKVLKVYQKMRRENLKMDLKAAHLFDRNRLESEILEVNPEHRNDIEIFVHNIRYSIRMATVLIALITLFGGILLFNHLYM